MNCLTRLFRKRLESSAPSRGTTCSMYYKFLGIFEKKTPLISGFRVVVEEIVRGNQDNLRTTKYSAIISSRMYCCRSKDDLYQKKARSMKRILDQPYKRSAISNFIGKERTKLRERGI